jgi:hypothetical protein
MALIILVRYNATLSDRRIIPTRRQTGKEALLRIDTHITSGSRMRWGEPKRLRTHGHTVWEPISTTMAVQAQSRIDLLRSTSAALM